MNSCKKTSTCHFCVNGVTLIISGVTVCLSSDYERRRHENFYLRSNLSCFKCNQKKKLVYFTKFNTLISYLLSLGQWCNF